MKISTYPMVCGVCFLVMTLIVWSASELMAEEMREYRGAQCLGQSDCCVLFDPSKLEYCPYYCDLDTLKCETKAVPGQRCKSNQNQSCVSDLCVDGTCQDRRDPKKKLFRSCGGVGTLGSCACGRGMHCSVSSCHDRNAICVDNGERGSRCNDHNDCGEGLYCGCRSIDTRTPDSICIPEPGEGVCSPELAENNRCSATAQCAAGLRCRAVVLPGETKYHLRCAPPVGESGECLDSNDCAPGFSCLEWDLDTRRCIESPGDVGESCSFGRPCGAGLTCVYEPGDGLRCKYIRPGEGAERSLVPNTPSWE